MFGIQGTVRRAKYNLGLNLALYRIKWSVLSDGCYRNSYICSESRAGGGVGG